MFFISVFIKIYHIKKVSQIDKKYIYKILERSYNNGKSEHHLPDCH